MPTRSLRSATMRWPDKVEVDTAFRSWANALKARYPSIVCIGYFGSYAKGTWGFGSDLDVIILVSQSAEPFHRRLLEVTDDGLPIPADIIVLTVEELNLMRQQRSRLAHEIDHSAVWL